MDGSAGFSEIAKGDEQDPSALEWIAPDNFDVQHAMMQTIRAEARQPSRLQHMKLEPHFAVRMDSIAEPREGQTRNEYTRETRKALEESLGLSQERGAPRTAHIGIAPVDSELFSEDRSKTLLLVAVSDLLKAGALTLEQAGEYAPPFYEHKEPAFTAGDLTAE